MPIASAMTATHRDRPAVASVGQCSGHWPEDAKQIYRKFLSCSLVVFLGRGKGGSELPPPP